MKKVPNMSFINVYVSDLCFMPDILWKKKKTKQKKEAHLHLRGSYKMDLSNSLDCAEGKALRWQQSQLSL